MLQRRTTPLKPRPRVRPWASTIWPGVKRSARLTGPPISNFAAKFEVGGAVNLADLFQPGQIVDTQGTTRGRGFSGVVRRWSFAGFVQTHGTHEYRRHGGSIGTNMTPGRTLPNIKMPGQYGNETVSVLNLRVARIDAEKGLLLVEGGIPGSKNALVTVRHGVKGRERKKR